MTARLFAQFDIEQDLALMSSMDFQTSALFLKLRFQSLYNHGLPADEEELKRFAKISCGVSSYLFKKLWPRLREKFSPTTSNTLVYEPDESKRGQIPSGGKGWYKQGADVDGGRSKWRLTLEQSRIYGETRSARLALARQRGTHTKAEWASVLRDCGNCCVKCGSLGSIVKDHITPIYQGGSDSIDNLQPLCNKCNSSKGSDTTDWRPERLKNASNALETPQSRRFYPNHQPVVEFENITGGDQPPPSVEATSTVEEVAPHTKETDQTLEFSLLSPLTEDEYQEFVIHCASVRSPDGVQGLGVPSKKLCQRLREKFNGKPVAEIVQNLPRFNGQKSAGLWDKMTVQYLQLEVLSQSLQRDQPKKKSAREEQFDRNMQWSKERDEKRKAAQ